MANPVLKNAPECLPSSSFQRASGHYPRLGAIRLQQVDDQLKGTPKSSKWKTGLQQSFVLGVCRVCGLVNRGGQVGRKPNQRSSTLSGPAVEPLLLLVVQMFHGIIDLIRGECRISS